MHKEDVRLPRGQQVMRLEETFTGQHVALVKVSSSLFAVCWVTPVGHLDDPVYGSELQSRGRFESRLTVH